MTVGHDFTGLPYLVDGMRGYLKAAGVTAPIVLGWTARTRQPGTARIAIVPGDPDKGDAGQLAAPKYPGGDSRPLNNWAELAIVSVWAVDASDPNDEELQYIATRSLFVWFRRALQKVAKADATLGKIKWTAAPNERAFGRELLCELTYNSPIVDVKVPVVVPVPTSPTGVFTTP